MFRQIINMKYLKFVQKKQTNLDQVRKKMKVTNLRFRIVSNRKRMNKVQQKNMLCKHANRRNGNVIPVHGNCFLPPDNPLSMWKSHLGQDKSIVNNSFAASSAYGCPPQADVGPAAARVQVRWYTVCSSVCPLVCECYMQKPRHR